MVLLLCRCGRRMLRKEMLGSENTVLSPTQGLPNLYAPMVVVRSLRPPEKSGRNQKGGPFDLIWFLCYRPPRILAKALLRIPRFLRYEAMVALRFPQAVLG